MTIATTSALSTVGIASRTASASTAPEGTSSRTALTAPQLPATIAGDGRYVMSLLNDFCADVADALGRVEASESTPSAIDNFVVTFDREGILWRWDEVATALYYELSADDKRLCLTTSTSDRTAPTAYSGTARLTAHLADGSTLTQTLSYTKPRPRAPQTITCTRTEGALVIGYSAIPSDCIGIELVIDGQTYRTTESAYILSQANASTISGAYYDSFGTGEATVTRTEVPAVTRFFAEQNGDWVDLSWERVDCYNATYTVKIAYRTPDWHSATTLLTTSDTHARIRFPQEGEVFFLIKAADSAGNHSTSATYATLNRAADRTHNVILTLDQADIAYSNVKTNLYYDALADGLRLTENARRGEYLIGVHLPTVYRARNWLAAKLIGVTDDTLVWDDSPFAWTSEDASATVWNGACGDISEATLAKEIAEESEPTATETVWTMADTLCATDGTAPVTSAHADTFDNGRWDRGLVLTPLTRLAYTVRTTDTFTFIFHLTACTAMTDSEIVTLSGEDGAFTLRYLGGAFHLCATDGHTLTLDYQVGADDHLTFAISQTNAVRTLRLASLAQGTDRTISLPLPPCTIVNTVCYHPTAQT